MILFGEHALRRVLSEFKTHYHEERPHQGKGNVILMPLVSQPQHGDSPIGCRQRLGGLLKNYHREAA